MPKLQSRTLWVIVLVGISLALLGFNQLGWLEPVKGVLLVPLSAIQRGLAQLWGGTTNLFQPNPDAEALRQRNAELEAKVTQLESQVTQLEEDQNELETLRGLLQHARSQPANTYLAADVIGRDPSPYLSYLILSRGSDDGVMTDMPVITERGLVGRIAAVTSSASKVLLIVDTGSAVNARLQKSRADGVVIGQLAGGLQMQYIAQQTKVEPGEVVLTSGMGGLYPPDIVLGTVTAVTRQAYEVLQTAGLTPAVDFNRLETVLIITDFRPVNFSPLLEATPVP